MTIEPKAYTLECEKQEREHMDRLFQLDMFGNEHEIKDEVKMDMEQQLIQIHQIEKEKKLDKLKEEVEELQESIQIYRNTHDIEPVLEELADCLIIVLGIAIVKHSVNIKEFISIVKSKINRSLEIKKLMKQYNLTYSEARKLYLRR